jgi:catabolite regulation protein CreA
MKLTPHFAGAMQNGAAFALATLLSVAPMAPMTALPAVAEDKRIVGEISGSGLVFKDVSGRQPARVLRAILPPWFDAPHARCACGSLLPHVRACPAV